VLVLRGQVKDDGPLLRDKQQMNPDKAMEDPPCGSNRAKITFASVRSEADSREWCNSADVRTFLLKRWELVSCLEPLRWLFKRAY
jgi:hypothetical protein